MRRTGAAARAGPVRVAQHRHPGRHEDGAHDGCVEQDRRRQAKHELMDAHDGRRRSRRRTDASVTSGSHKLSQRPRRGESRQRLGARPLSRAVQQSMLLLPALLWLVPSERAGAGGAAAAPSAHIRAHRVRERRPRPPSRAVGTGRYSPEPGDGQAANDPGGVARRPTRKRQPAGRYFCGRPVVPRAMDVPRPGRRGRAAGAASPRASRLRLRARRTDVAAHRGRPPAAGASPRPRARARSAHHGALATRPGRRFHRRVAAPAQLTERRRGVRSRAGSRARSVSRGPGDRAGVARLGG